MDSGTLVGLGMAAVILGFLVVGIVLPVSHKKGKQLLTRNVDKWARNSPNGAVSRGMVREMTDLTLGQKRCVCFSIWLLGHRNEVTVPTVAAVKGKPALPTPPPKAKGRADFAITPAELARAAG